MNYWSIETSLLGSKAFASVPAAAVGTWLRLMAYAVEQELPGGVIEGLGNWDPRELLVTIACDPLEVLAVCKAKLAHFEDGDLHIHHFPAEEMAALHAKREGGKNGGRPRSNPEKIARKTTTETMPETMPETIPLRIGKDRIGEEREREEEVRVSPPDGAHPRDASEVFRYTESLMMGWTKAHAEFWYNHMESKGWALNEHGTQVITTAKQWRAMCRNAKSWVIDRVAKDSRTSETDIPAPKKNKSAAQQETEARRMAIARETWPELAEFLPWEALSPEQRLCVQQEDQRREAERRDAA